MGDGERSKMYKETQSSIIKILDKGLSIDKNIYMNQLVLIKNDITAKDENVRKAALDMLDFLLSLNVEDIQTEVIKILHDGTVNKFIQNCVLNSIKKKIICTISDDKFNFTEILTPWKNQNVNKLTNIIEDICLNDLPKNKCKHFFINNVIPTMMSINTNNDIRNTLTDMAFMLSTIVPISDLSSEELNIFLKEVNMK
ncbi:hypothetical protein NQ314_003215 [Rhamnusium bicolor]|uniref:Uncharacterized protein n=1 Tax=Rhamnusium bicolor TaxID=1586634 RepID=A0AAV8ZR02_9CUCU|nr:hypothetical protein NQ314_003215 [Rhamnusium bicolor]